MYILKNKVNLYYGKSSVSPSVCLSVPPSHPSVIRNKKHTSENMNQMVENVIELCVYTKCKVKILS